MNKFFQVKLFSFVAFLFISSICLGRCVDFDEEPPNFCASLTVKEIVRTDPNECYLNADVNDFRPAEPLKKNYDYFSNRINQNKGSLLVLSKELCQNIKPGNIIRGVIVAICFDNTGDGLFGISNFFKRLVGKQDLYPKFRYSKTALVNFKNGGMTEISCGNSLNNPTQK